MIWVVISIICFALAKLFDTLMNRYYTAKISWFYELASGVCVLLGIGLIISGVVSLI